MNGLSEGFGITWNRLTFNVIKHKVSGYNFIIHYDIPEIALSRPKVWRESFPFIPHDSNVAPGEIQSWKMGESVCVGRPCPPVEVVCTVRVKHPMGAFILQGFIYIYIVFFYPIIEGVFTADVTAVMMKLSFGQNACGCQSVSIWEKNKV